MKAIVSAKAGIALIVYGNETVVLNSDGDEKTYPASSINYLLAGATDVKSIAIRHKSDSIAILRKEVNKYKSLTLTLMLFDESEDDETLALGVECLADFLKDADVVEYVENSLFSKSVMCPFGRALLFSSSVDCLASLLKTVEAKQDSINRIRQTWDELPEDLFVDPLDKICYEEYLVTSGIFKSIVLAEDDPYAFSLIQVRCLSDLCSFKNSRAIIGQWLSHLIPAKTKLLRPSIVSNSQNNSNSPIKYHKPKIKPHDAFLNAVKQKNAIFPLLKKCDWAKARRYVEDLIKSQSTNSEPHHISKSLCDLAQHAKVVRNYSLQLELARRAVEISPDDGWAHGQVADAYICLSQFDRAIKAFDEAAIFGQEEFAKIGYARVLREQGKMVEAIAAFEELSVQFSESDVVANCYAEVLKDVWRIDEALLVYNEAIDKFGYNSTSYCGKASLLKLIGKLDEALVIYNYARGMGEDTHYIGSGIADVYRLQGDYDKSIAEYDFVIKKFPDEPVPKCSRANLLKIKGDLPAALAAYRKVAEEFPYDVAPKEGIAETLREQNDLPQSLVMFDEILRDFPMSIRARNGRANLYKWMGQYERSLQCYDENVRDFPYDIVAWGGRADLLKHLGFFNEAIETYHRIGEFNPYDKSYLYSIAAIYGVKGEYDAALALLPSDIPQTRDDWFAYQVKGTILMKCGRIDEAVHLFKDSISKVQFYSVAKFFKNALSVASLRKKGSVTPVDCSVDTVSQNDYLRNVINLHVYGELGQLEKAEESYAQVQNCPPYIISLRDELSLRYIKRFSILNYDMSWIYERECDMLLLNAA